MWAARAPSGASGDVETGSAAASLPASAGGRPPVVSLVCLCCHRMVSLCLCLCALISVFSDTGHWLRAHPVITSLKILFANKVWADVNLGGRHSAGTDGFRQPGTQHCPPAPWARCPRPFAPFSE